MANLENLKKIDVALCWLEDLKPDDVVTIPVGRSAERLVDSKAYLVGL